MTYIITGGAGFIGSVLVGYLNQQGIDDIVVVDHLDTTEKWKNLLGKKYKNYFDKGEFLDIIKKGGYIQKSDIVIHLGACSATTEADAQYLMENNTKYSRYLYEQCTLVGANFIYSSSAATYGDGIRGYSDDDFDLQPLNMYGYSKHLFDQRVLNLTDNFQSCPTQVVGLKFFNVYGPNEYHKANMCSVIFHGYQQIQKENEISLFKSYKEGYKDGEQKRDFIYVKDVVSVIDFFIKNPQKNGIFNVGTGLARSFNDLAKSIFDALAIPSIISYKEMPDILKGKYQYFTEANMKKLKDIGYTKQFYSLEEGIKDYVQNYLDRGYLIY